jgi:hypothetical protein
MALKGLSGPGVHGKTIVSKALGVSRRTEAAPMSLRHKQITPHVQCVAKKSTKD